VNITVLVPVVAGVVVRQGETFLLVEEIDPPHRGLWNFPAGRVEVGESIEQAALREALEEPPKHLFEAEIVGGEPEAGDLRVRWFSLEEVRAMRRSLRGEVVLEILEGVSAGSSSDARGLA
jgi:hypothetical protein